MTTENNTRPVALPLLASEPCLGSYATLRAFVVFFRAIACFFRADDTVFPALCAALTTDGNSFLGCLAAR
jgi:hypothetical protein